MQFAFQIVALVWSLWYVGTFIDVGNILPLTLFKHLIYIKNYSNYMSVSIKGNFVDVINKKIFSAEVVIENGLIKKINPLADGEMLKGFIIPGFVDAHVHIESSMLIPAEFAKIAVIHGTVATVSDPHEIGNVCGMEGVEFMINNGNTVPFKFNFGAPSCVPATVFETAGAKISSEDVDALLQRKEIKYLSEMMNFPGVLNGDEEVFKKIAAAKKYHKPIDGHAPGLKGEAARKYIDAGITTDHECFTIEEALDKLSHGMKILIREGSAAKNFEALIPLLHDHPEMIMFCSDDKHPDSLVDGHINILCNRAVAKGINVFNVLMAACINPVLHYKLDVGLLRETDPADFVVVDDLENFNVIATYIKGIQVAKDGESLLIPSMTKVDIINNFDCEKILPSVLIIKPAAEDVMVIGALEGQLITNKIIVKATELLNTTTGYLEGNVEKDIMKIVVINRYSSADPAIGFIKNFGIKRGAIASSVAHDSHNIIAVGVDDESIAFAINLVISERGGVSAVDVNTQLVLPLPVAGLMSNKDGWLVAKQYTEIDKLAKEMGSTLLAPFMTLSFMALLVIPHLKMSDKGLFDGDSFSFV